MQDWSFLGTLIFFLQLQMQQAMSEISATTYKLMNPYTTAKRGHGFNILHLLQTNIEVQTNASSIGGSQELSL